MNWCINAIFYLMVAYQMLIVVNIILSWFEGLYKYKFFRALYKVTNIYMEPFHGALVIGAIDFTPIVGITLLEVIYQVAQRLIF